MALYYRDSGLTWKQYLQVSSFADDITNSINEGSDSAEEGLLGLSDEMSTLSDDVAGLNDSIFTLGAKFSYDMALLLDQMRIQSALLGGVIGILSMIGRNLEGARRTLDEIGIILQFPVLIKARELAVIGFVRVSKGLLSEGLEALLESVELNKTNPLVQLEIGKLYLYGENDTDNLINLPLAEEHLLLAARYADNKTEYAEALLHAGMARYLQADEYRLAGKEKRGREYLKGALGLVQLAIEVDPEFQEGKYHCAKFAALLGDSEIALGCIETLVLEDREYCQKIDDDKDFDPIRKDVNTLFLAVSNRVREGVKTSLPLVRKGLLDDWVYPEDDSGAVELRTNIAYLLEQAEEFVYQKKDSCFHQLTAKLLIKDAQSLFKNNKTSAIKSVEEVERLRREEEQKKRKEQERELQRQKEEEERRQYRQQKIREQDERFRKEEEIRAKTKRIRKYRKAHNLCLGCGKKLTFWRRFSFDAAYCSSDCSGRDVGY